MPRRYGRVGSLLDAILGVPDAALSFGSGMVAGPASGFYAAQRAARGQPVSREDTEGFADFLTYRPRTETGKAALGKLGEGIETVTDALPEWSRDLRGKAGEAGYEAGGALGGAIGEMIPTLAEEVLGRGFGALKQATKLPKSQIWGDETMLRKAGRGDQVDRALEMQAAGASPDRISSETSIYIGPASGGVPAGIISTKDADFNAWLLTGEPQPFMGIIDNKDVPTGFDYMPNKEKLNVAYGDDAYGGSYMPTGQRMKVGYMENTGTVFGDTLDHEASHFVQHQTGMPRGGSVGRFLYDVEDVKRYPGVQRGEARIAAQQMLDSGVAATDKDVARALYDSTLGERTARIGEAGRRLTPAEARMTDPFSLFDVDHGRLSRKSQELLKHAPARERNYVDPLWLRRWAEGDW